MAASHYATLGVATNSPSKVIRAAYLQLMRRYHPDKNPSAEAATRVRAVTAAYAVLSVPEERAKYDLERRAQRAAPPTAPAAERERRHRIGWPALPRIAWPTQNRIAWPALIAAGIAFLVIVANIVAD